AQLETELQEQQQTAQQDLARVDQAWLLDDMLVVLGQAATTANQLQTASIHQNGGRNPGSRTKAVAAKAARPGTNAESHGKPQPATLLSAALPASRDQH